MSWRTNKKGQHYQVRARKGGQNVRMSQKGSSFEGMTHHSMERVVQPNRKVSIEEGYGFKQKGDEFEVKLIRAGQPNTDDFRGGTWYEVEKYPGYNSGYQTGTWRHSEPGVGGTQVSHSQRMLKNPYYVDITNAKNEGYYPLITHETITGKKIESEKGLHGMNAEKTYARYEREDSEALRAKGYDSVILYYRLGVHTIPTQVFVLR